MMKWVWRGVCAILFLCFVVFAVQHRRIEICEEDMWSDIDSCHRVFKCEDDRWTRECVEKLMSVDLWSVQFMHSAITADLNEYKGRSFWPFNTENREHWHHLHLGFLVLDAYWRDMRDVLDKYDKSRTTKE